MFKTQLNTFDNKWFDPEAGLLKRLLWYITNAIFFNSNALLPYSMKNGLLNLFGAQILEGVVIKPKVNIKYPWKLKVGENTWIGEGVWIDNLDQVTIGANVCISQGALILSGNHNYSKTSFDLILKPITIEDGVWVGAKAIVTQGVVLKTHAVLAVNSVASQNLEAYSIYRGNPAVKIKDRKLE